MSDSTFDLSVIAEDIDASAQAIVLAETTRANSKLSSNAVGTIETVYNILTGILPPNPQRKGIVIQNPTDPVDVYLGSTNVATYQLPTNSICEIENFVGSVSAETITGSTNVFVTEKI